MLQFHEFVQQFGRSYLEGSEEFTKRQAIFNENIAAIKAQNEAFGAGESTWAAAVNHMADMSKEEIMKAKGYKKSHNPTERRNSAMLGKTRNIDDLPSTVDWRDYNGKSYVSAPKNQGSCGSCWTFAATETIESHAAISLGIPVPVLAPQQFVDCVQNPDSCGGTGGCEGATAELAFNYSKVGLSLNSDYKYTGRDGACKPPTPAVFVGDFVQLPKNDESALLETVATVGPVAISVAASSWSFYSHGIFDGRLGRGCDVEVNHAVQLVGYGPDYWLVRNSWGGSWGEGGYIRIKRTQGNEPCAVDEHPLDGVCGKKGVCKCASEVTYCGTCAILSDSSYPINLSVP